MSCKGCIGLGVALLVITLLAIGGAGMRAGRFLTLTDPLSPADAIVVLGGDNGDFTRAREAIRLFQEDYAPTVVIMGPPLRDIATGCTPAQLSLGIAQSLGLPASAALTIDGTGSTYDEAMRLRRLVQQHGWDSLIVVTDVFHTRRAGRTFRTLLPDVVIYVSAASYPDYDAGRWWRTEDSLVYVFNEVIKLGFYWVKYGIVPVEI